MGFTRIVLPAANLDAASATVQDCGDASELVGVRTVGEALDELI